MFLVSDFICLWFCVFCEDKGNWGAMRGGGTHPPPKWIEGIKYVGFHVGIRFEFVFYLARALLVSPWLYGDSFFRCYQPWLINCRALSLMTKRLSARRQHLKHQISQKIVSILLLLLECMGKRMIVSNPKITSQKGYPFWPTHINSLPISLFRTASMMDFLHPFFVVRIHKLQNHPSMPMSPRLSQGGATCRPHMAWVPFLFLHHMESTQLYESESFVIMLQMMNLTRMAIPHCIFNVTQLGTSTMPQ